MLRNKFFFKDPFLWRDSANFIHEKNQEVPTDVSWDMDFQKKERSAMFEKAPKSIMVSK